MRKLAVLTFVSLDGVMQGPTSPEGDSSGGFTQGGWAMGCWEEVMAQVMKEAMATPYDLLLGRKTYESFAAHWPNAGDTPIANRLNRATKHVVTSRLKQLEWNNSVPLSGDIAAEVTRIKNQTGPLLQVHGSWQLIQTLLAHDLIDEFRLWIFPVLLGSGKRLFEQGTKMADLTLVKNAPCSNGAMMAVYQRR